MLQPQLSEILQLFISALTSISTGQFRAGMKTEGPSPQLGIHGLPLRTFVLRAY